MASEIVKTVGLVATILAALATFIVFLMRQGFKHLLAKDIEKFKLDLRLAAFEHETKFLKLHERRVEVVAEIYQRLVRTENTFKYFVKPFVKVGEPPIVEKEKDAYEAAKSFSEYFNENRLWLDADTCSKIEEFALPPIY